MPRLPILAWIGNAASVLLGKHGDVSRQTQDAGCSRQVAYQHADKVQQAVADAQLPGPSRDELLEENRRLREQVAQLEQRLEHAVVLDFDKQQQLTVTTFAMGLSLGQIREVLALLLPAGQCPGRSTLGRWVRQHALRAGRTLEVLDEHSRPAVKDLCPDEIFFHRQPVLVGVEPHSLALLLCQRSKDRTGATWQQALTPFTALEFAVSDQGTGLQAGLKALAQDRRQAGGKPLEIGLDVFHIEHEARPVLGRWWRQLEACWERAEQADRKVAATRDDLRGPTSRARAAWRAVESRWSFYERQEAAWKRAKAALGLFRPDGRLNDRAWAAQEIEAACKTLAGPVWAKVRRLLRDARTLTFLDRLHRRLQEAEPCADLREALVRLWRWERGPRTGLSVAAAVAQRVLCAKRARDWEASYGRVAAVLSGVVRASSAVECVNSVLRMQQARHRGLGQELLDLKRLYWNSRAFRWGKRKGKCPYQLLGVALPSYDFWQLLRCDPQKLKQQLSTPGVAA